MFGPHLLLEATNCNKDHLANQELMYTLLDELPNKMGMTKIIPPYTFKYSGLHADDWGITGIVIIAESHLAFHTFPDKGFLAVDIFSCKEFDVKMAIDEITKAYGAETWEEQLLMRGREFPRSSVKAEMIVAEDRERMLLKL